MPAPLPNAKQQFLDGNGAPLAGGSVYTYVVGTTTAKTTWRDAEGQAPNSNPIVLDANGEAIIFGSGLYRQQVYDYAGTLIWDQVTGTPAPWDLVSQPYLTDTGTANALAITMNPPPPSMAALTGQAIFLQIANSNTGATTLIVEGFGAYPVLQGGAALVSGALATGALYPMVFTGTAWQLIGAPSSSVTISQLQAGTISPVFNNVTANGQFIVNNQNSSSVSLTGTSSNGVSIQMTGQGNVTPAKYLRVFNGGFQILDSAYTRVLLSLDDSGNLHVAGNIQSNGI